MVKAGMKKADISKAAFCFRSIRNMAVLSSHRCIPPKLSWSEDDTEPSGEKVLAKATYIEKHQSVWNMTKKLTTRCHPASKTTVHQYLIISFFAIFHTDWFMLSMKWHIFRMCKKISVTYLSGGYWSPLDSYLTSPIISSQYVKVEWRNLTHFF